MTTPDPENFVAFILTHGRPDRVHTYNTLKKLGYTGRIIIVIDNEDKSADEYRKKFGDQVYQFDKAGVATRMDEGDNFGDRRAIVYARNACFEIAEELGIDYFIQLDDDYTEFRYRKNHKGEFIEGKVDYVRNLDGVFRALLDYYISIPALSIAVAQGGDFIGGTTGKGKPKRKCMNSFICSRHRAFKFVGRINEDVNTYTHLASRGGLFLTIMTVSLQQKQTQSNKGGMTELYLDSGTYVKSIYSVIYQPSSVCVGVLKDRKSSRLHHRVSWRHTVPQLLDEKYKRSPVNGS
jgi:hypothetical protein